MGYELVRKILRSAPPDWSTGERLVALIIADSANDRTGLSPISHRQLREMTGYTKNSLGFVLRRLDGRGLEFRQRKTTGTGQGMRYQVPPSLLGKD